MGKTDGKNMYSQKKMTCLAVSDYNQDIGIATLVGCSRTIIEDRTAKYPPLLTQAMLCTFANGRHE
jgi:hypothetical protein